MNGFYLMYATGRAGNSVVLFIIRDQAIIGADIGGMKYDGEVKQQEDGSFHCKVVYVIPPGTTLITGTPPPNTPQRIPVEFDLPADFFDGRVITIVTPLGAVNARFEKIREL